MLSFKQRAINGTIWTILVYSLSQVLRFGSNLILTRLLAPEVFGLMALVNTLIIGLELFSDLGINVSIIQNKRAEEASFLNTAWTLQIIRGFGLWMCCNLAAWPVAHFYQEPKLFWIAVVISLSILMQGFTSTSLATLNRKIEVGKLMRFELSIQVLTLTVMLAWAYWQKSIWALVGGSLFSSLVRMIWSHRLDLKTSNRLAWDRKAIEELISFGKWIFISTALNFLSTQTDRLILGKLLSFQMLGVYIIAITLSEIPKQIIGQINFKVIFPLLSRKKYIPRQQLREDFLRIRWLILIGAILLITLLFSCGDFLVLRLYDARYKDAAWMIPILALGFWPFLLVQTSYLPLLVIGKLHYSTLGNFFKLLFIIILLPFGFSKMGILGAIIVIACNDFPLYGAVTYGLQQEKLSTVWQDVKATLALSILLSLVILVRVMLKLGIPISISLFSNNTQFL